MDVQLHPATRQDLPRLLEWMRQLRLDDPMHSQAFVPKPPSQAAMTQLIDDAAAGRVWVIRDDANPVGYAVLVFSFSVEFGGRTAFIDELFIEASFRGKGIGRRVIELLTSAARSLDVQNLLLEVSDGNLPARRMYESSGFVEREYHLMSKWLKEDPS
jgi:ribosomal protein S18 acetylase RimI-like enzyme